MAKPKATASVIKKHIEYIKMIAEGNLKAEEYFSEKRDDAGRYIYQWPELTDIIENNFDVFLMFLGKLTLIQRRIVFLRDEIINFSQTKLSENYGIHKDLLRKFIGININQYKKKGRKETQPIIRKIAPLIEDTRIDKRIIAHLAILMRVPPCWITNEELIIRWTTKHYKKVYHEIVDEKGLLMLLESVNTIKYHDVLPVILNFRGCELILRLELKKNAFLLEYVNEGLELGAFEELVVLLGTLVVKTGVVHTVIPTHYNLAIIGGNHKLITPPTFRNWTV